MADSPRRRYTRPSRSPSPYKGRQKQMSRSRSPVAQSQSRSPSPDDPRSQARSRSRSPAREREPEAVNHGNTLYITGLSSRVTDKELREYFNKEGKVVSCHVVLEPHTRVSRGFAFITMDTVEDAERCIKYLNQSELQGRNITVEKKTLCKLCASNQDAEFINFNFSSYSLINGQPKGLLCNTRFTTTKRSKFSTKPEHSPSTPHQLINGHFQHISQGVWWHMHSNVGCLLVGVCALHYSRRGRPRTPTPGSYLGHRYERREMQHGGRFRRGGYGRDDYYGNSYRRSPPPMYRDYRDTRDYPPYRDTRDYSPHRDARDYYDGRGGRGYSPHRSPPPYGGRARRERSRSLPYSPYRMAERGYGRRAGGGGYDR